MNKRCGLCMVLCTLLVAAGAGAQSAQKLQDVLQSDVMTYGQACYLSAVHSGTVSDGASYADAFAALQKAGTVPSSASEGDALPLSALSYICCKTWNVQGSLLYRLFPGPRYAFKLLQAKGIVSSLADPEQLVSGREAVNIISNCIELDAE